MNGGQYLMLFMTALLMMWLIKPFPQKEFRRYALAMLLLLVFPLTGRLLQSYQTGFYGKENIWILLPVTALLPLGLVMVWEILTKEFTALCGRRGKGVSKRKKQFLEAAAVLALTVLLFLCGTLSLGRTVTNKADGDERIPAREEAVLRLLDISKDDFVTLLAPDDVVLWARIYSGRILLPIGRNVSEPELSAFSYEACPADMEELREWVNGTGTADKSGEFLDYCFSIGCDYLIFAKERHAEEELQQALEGQAFYSLYQETESYVIYRLP